MKKRFLILAILPFLGCVNQNSSKVDKSKQIEESKTLSVDENEQIEESKLLSAGEIIKQEISKDSLRIVKLKNEENEIKELKKRGIIGVWLCDYSGYESIITMYKKNSHYSTEVEFTKSKMKTITEKLKKKGDKLFIVGSKVKEYYSIQHNGNLEMGDKQGLLFNASDIMPGTKIKKLPKLNISKVVGKDIFFIAGNYSKSFPNTIEGTNSKVWIVYYEDINIVFNVDKLTKKIISAVNGK